MKVEHSPLSINLVLSTDININTHRVFIFTCTRLSYRICNVETNSICEIMVKLSIAFLLHRKNLNLENNLLYCKLIG